MSDGGHQFDTKIDIVTPENIAFSYRVAGPFQRLPAYLIDLVIRIGIMLAIVAAVWLMLMLAAAAALFSPPAFLFTASVIVGSMLVMYFLVEWFYGGLLETFWNGQTIGKRSMRLRVVTVYGQPITGLQAVLRNVLRVLDMSPFVLLLSNEIAMGLSQFFWSYLGTFQLGLLAMMFNSRYQRLGDLVCGTMVVVEEPPPLYGVAWVQEPEVLQLASLLPPGLRVTRSMAQTLASYMQRRPGFSWLRRLEIARHLGEPLRQKLGLPAGIHYDTLLCAVYYKTFIAERPDAIEGGTPFGPARVYG
jgi:uncharacterized RDD family membrane protein YckC